MMDGPGDPSRLSKTVRGWHLPFEFVPFYKLLNLLLSDPDFLVGLNIRQREVCLNSR